MERLAHASERLDGPLDDSAELAGNLRDLRRVNRFLGGASLSVRAFEHLAGDAVEPVRVLDVGTGAADIPMALLGEAERRRRRLSVTAIDSRPEVLAVARSIDRRIAATSGLHLAVADGRSLPYPDASFDVAHASLLLHHLEPDEAVRLLAELRRVARVGVIVNDLVRSRIYWLGAWLLSHLFSANRFSRYDAPLSVRRAYSLKELRGLIRLAGLETGEAFRGPLGHRWALVLRPIGALREERD